MKNRLMIPAVLSAAVIAPLFIVMQSPGFASLRAVDFTLIFSAGAAAGALLSLAVARRSSRAA